MTQNIDREQLKKLAEHLDKHPFSLKGEEGDYWEEDENGVVFLRRKSGAPVLMMSRADYEAAKDYADLKDHSAEKKGCQLCGKPACYAGALFCGAACCAQWEAGLRPQGEEP